MTKRVEVRSIRLRGGIVFEATFTKTAPGRFSVQAAGRPTMTLRLGDDGPWATRVEGVNRIHYGMSPAQVFDRCARAYWRTSAEA